MMNTGVSIVLVIFGVIGRFKRYNVTEQKFTISQSICQFGFDEVLLTQTVSVLGLKQCVNIIDYKNYVNISICIECVTVFTFITSYGSSHSVHAENVSLS